jgi:CTP:phosphocholine cytidylyltransferase-like protein
MRKSLPFFIVLMLLFGCKRQIVNEPKNLIDRETMVNILYDLSLLEAMQIENPSLMDSFKNNSNEYILKKYKIDSLQFIQSNSYYASDYKEYEKIYSQVKARIDLNKAELETKNKTKKN